MVDYVLTQISHFIEDSYEVKMTGLSQTLDSVKAFKILPKLVVSDHLPCSIVIRFNTLSTLLTVLAKCFAGNFNYESQDRSTLLKPKIRLGDIDCSPIMVRQVLTGCKTRNVLLTLIN